MNMRWFTISGYLPNASEDRDVVSATLADLATRLSEAGADVESSETEVSFCRPTGFLHNRRWALLNDISRGKLYIVEEPEGWQVKWSAEILWRTRLSGIWATLWLVALLWWCCGIGLPYTLFIAVSLGVWIERKCLRQAGKACAEMFEQESPSLVQNHS